MDYIALLTIAVGLSMDAFAVAVSSGATTKEIKINHMIKVATFFGLFQAAMPVIGWLVGIIAEQFISSFSHYISFALLAYIGGKMIYDAIKERKAKDNKTEDTQPKDYINTKTLFLMAVATSIDALATGVILPSAVGATTTFLMITAVGIIGLVTFTLSFVGVFIGKKFGSFLNNGASIFGGTILILLGIKILVEGIFF